MPLTIRLFGFGGHLAELIDAIRGGGETAPAVQHVIDRLNRDFGNLREILQSAEPSLAEAILQPVLDRFSESLAAVALARPDLSAKCESLTGRLGKLVGPDPSWSAWDSDDASNPF